MTDDGANRWKIYPLLYFEPNWPGDAYGDFALGMRLIKADLRSARVIKERIEEKATLWHSVYLFEPGEDQRAYKWLLAIHVPEATEHVPINDIRMSFVDRVEQSIVDTFLSCLGIAGPSDVVANVSFYAELRDGALDADTIGDADCWDEETFDRPTGEPVQDRLTENDLPLIRQVWASLVSVRKLEKWISLPFQEKFFAELDKKTNKRVEAELRRRLPELPSAQFASVLASLKEMDFWDSMYAEAFRAVFAEKEEEHFNSRTRIGRAIGIFEGGHHLPKLHAFLSMCLVLETIYTVGEGEVTHKLTTRLAKTLAGSPEEIEELYKKAQRVYRARSNVVHGSTSIMAVEEEDRLAAFHLARRALQGILTSNDLLNLYASPGTHDTRRREKDLKLYFRRIDLGLG